jgi:3-hydroxybutyryl-CoA dehydrogenase
MVNMPHQEFSSAVVIGTGMMGPGIALSLALGGVRCTLLSRSAEGAARGKARVGALATVLSDSGLATPEAAGRAAAEVTASTEFKDAGAADLVVESGPEDMNWKQDVFARLEGIVSPDCVLGSNTSGLSITAIASRCARPERVLTTHFWNPPHLMPLVELVQGSRTSPAVVDRVCELLEACHKVPVIIRKDRPGQLGNRLQMALVREAANIIAEGIADAEAVDAVAKNGFGLRLPAYGILEHQDVVGLDLGVRVADYVARDLFNEPKAPEYFHDLVRSGNLGVKTGRGFYDWSAKSADEVRARRDSFLIEVLQYRRRKAD